MFWIVYYPLYDRRKYRRRYGGRGDGFSTLHVKVGVRTASCGNRWRKCVFGQFTWLVGGYSRRFQSEESTETHWFRARPQVLPAWKP